ncbi:MAG: VOC family protein, partial [Caulobacteraceae bacterium]
VNRPSQGILGVDRVAIVADPHGAGFFLFAPAPAETPPARPAPGSVGSPGWHELHAGDLETDFAFYSKLFGWTKAETHDMGPMGVYQLFAAGAEPIGGMMTKMAQTPVPHWLYYFTVAEIQAAARRVRDGGGQVLNGPHEVPGGMWVLQARDPQGGMFALVAPGG